MKAKLEVLVRIRPKKNSDSEVGVIPKDNKTVSVLNKNGEQSLFTFAQVYGPETSQTTIFDENLSDLINVAITGKNVSVMSYGPTGTGKTYTMVGTKTDPGIIPRTAAQLFSEVRERQDVQIGMSYVEIYNEKVRDLIGGKQNFQDVKITSTKNKEIMIDGITTLPIEDFRSFSRFFKDANEKRSVATTMCNSESSRSHAILTFQVSMKVIHDGVATSKFSKISLIDLAGSEDNRRTGNDGQRFVESTKINLSLTVLKRVIKAVADKRKAIPYRESKLTRILADSIGGNTHSLLFLNVAPEVEHLADTGLSMSFSMDAKRVINEPFENIKTEKLSPSRHRCNSELPVSTPKIEPPSPMSNTPMRDVNNMKESFLNKYSSRKREIQARNTPTKNQNDKVKKRIFESTHIDDTNSNSTNSTLTVSNITTSQKNTTRYQNFTLTGPNISEFLTALNTSSDLTSFKHIGPKKAVLIANRRPFENFEDFKSVVGETLASKIYENSL